jgi:predicted ATP-dependent endonuclease of OLD family
LCFLEFYHKHFADFENGRNKKIVKSEKLLNKYIEGKSIQLTPAGIIVSKTNIKRTKKLHLTDIRSIKSLGLDLLSSGEKKILLILLLCFFSENKTLIIDEPELSLSIIWQEQLLPDILKHTTVEKIIVATHSPAIISDDSLIDYIVPLPQK